MTGVWGTACPRLCLLSGSAIQRSACIHAFSFLGTRIFSPRLGHGFKKNFWHWNIMMLWLPLCNRMRLWKKIHCCYWGFFFWSSHCPTWIQNIVLGQESRQVTNRLQMLWLHEWPYDSGPGPLPPCFSLCICKMGIIYSLPQKAKLIVENSYCLTVSSVSGSLLFLLWIRNRTLHAR